MCSSTIMALHNTQTNLLQSLRFIATITILISAATLIVSLSGLPMSGVRSIVQGQAIGGITGKPFNDMLPNRDNGLPIITGIDSINISFQAGSQIESIQVTYRLFNGTLYAAPRHGGNKTRTITIKLAKREYVVKIEGRYD